ncbi:MAG: SPOR domain-containing protein [Treponema sp.]|jgi:cell division septation protein DedD|nr:SPOR domain-containing protein [Treponema sp.]
MGLIKKSRFQKAGAFFLIWFAAASVYGQLSSVPLSTEVKSIEKKLSSPLSPAEKNRALRDLARLMELSGNIEAAGRIWGEAARALPSDLDAPVKSAACLAAAGEFDAALNLLAPVFQAAAASGSSEPGLRARYLAAQIEAFRSGETPALSSLLQDAAFAAYRPGIYYSIWKISGDGASRNRLISEFPHSPEALSLKDGSAVAAAPTALWLLGLPSAGPVVAASPAEPRLPSRAGPAIPAETQSGGPVMLQAGLFGREENARALAGRLRGAGFTPVVSTKTVNGTEYWAVGVLPGGDHAATILLLKDAGFEAFPVY